MQLQYQVYYSLPGYELKASSSFVYIRGFGTDTYVQFRIRSEAVKRSSTATDAGIDSTVTRMSPKPGAYEKSHNLFINNIL